jgi:hypothetical protein
MGKQYRPTVFAFRIEDRGLSFFLGFLVLIAVFVPMVRPVTIRANRTGPDFRAHALLGCDRNHSP